MRMKSTRKKSGGSLKRRLAFGFLTAVKKSSTNSASRHHAIRAAAYASMAAAVGPRKAWSRAILRNMVMRHRRKEARTHHHHRYRNRNDGLGIGEELSHLSAVVPGGAAMDSCKLLKETGHYIKCLRAQVQIMRKILDYSST